ncbi:morn repeat protein [Stylonychia lemnae]|uniref:Morn repeat protein n=1 Tax=Stylonychia lemnae TaxID=5949 RepID=A0A078ATU0_STYLE|nr:morn repeat protein [Stylonychia lemnae]|eukprot:CDW85669.1 morn repeat protein [Stylonychia lemnae]
MKAQDLKKQINRGQNSLSNEIIRLIRDISNFKLSHSSIINFKESYFTQDDQFIVITELAEDNLRSFREANPVISNEEIVEIMLQLMKGINYLHKQNVSPIDLTPKSIQVLESGKKFKLSNYGTSSSNVEQNVIVGKKYFNAPEIGIDEDNTNSHQADIWSAGVLLHYLCTEQCQYGPQKKRLADIKTQDPAFEFKLPERRQIFEPLLNRMLKLKPDERPQSLEIISELCLLISDSLHRHIDEEEKSSNVLLQNAFKLTLKSSNDKVNEILAKLGDFNFPVIQNIHPNPDRIFVPTFTIDENHQYQGEIDSYTRQPDGRGRSIYSDGQLQEGIWQDGKLRGLGRQIDPKGSYYVGEFQNCRRNGKGQYVFPSGSMQEGNFLNGRIEGLGFYWYHNGNYYYGQYDDDKRCGLGIAKYDEDILIGQWNNGQSDGIVMHVPQNGDQIEIRLYEDGQLQSTLFRTENTLFDASE